MNSKRLFRHVRDQPPLVACMSKQQDAIEAMKVMAVTPASHYIVILHQMGHEHSSYHCPVDLEHAVSNSFAWHNDVRAMNASQVTETLDVVIYGHNIPTCAHYRDDWAKQLLDQALIFDATLIVLNRHSCLPVGLRNIQAYWGAINRYWKSLVEMPPWSIKMPTLWWGKSGQGEPRRDDGNFPL